MKKRIAAAMVLLAGLGGGAALTAAGEVATQAAAAPAPAVGPTQAREIALVRAAGAGDPNPAVAIEADTNAEAAVAMAAPRGAALAEPEGGVYLVTMRGNFTLGQAHLPRGAQAPTGTVLKVTVDRSGFITGLHLGER